MNLYYVPNTMKVLETSRQSSVLMLEELKFNERWTSREFIECEGNVQMC